MGRKNSIEIEEFPPYFLLFPTQLGWMGIVWTREKVRGLTLGHKNPTSAGIALGKLLGYPIHWADFPYLNGGILGGKIEPKGDVIGPLPLKREQTVLMDQLRAYAEGKIVHFTDVLLDPGPCSQFQARVYALCRQIPYGSTVTYGQLALGVGSPRAARAVGQCLARNPIPILIPCHRVVGTGGKLVGFSAPGGLAIKQRLLRLEAHALQRKEPLTNL